MALVTGQSLLQCVAERIVAGYLERQGADAVALANQWPSTGNHGGVDLDYRKGGVTTKVKVKADPYFGKDPSKTGDRRLTFYRPEGSNYGLEAIANSATREQGWIFNSEADELHYYLCVIAQTEEEVAALMNEPDEIFFSELRVERDELHVLPMRQLREWFEEHFEEYTPRPVMLGAHSAWFRFVPRDVVRTSVPGVRVSRSIFATLSR